MVVPNPMRMLSAAMEPLGIAFDAKLEFSRSCGSVTWSFCGQRVRVDDGADGATATFLDCPVEDRATGGLGSAVYARGAGPYPLDGAGAERLVADIRDFFSGAREPAFTFRGVE